MDDRQVTEKIDFKLSDQVNFDKFIGCISNNLEQEVIDFLAAIPRLAKMHDTGKETALYKALMVKNTSEVIIYALIRAGEATSIICLLYLISHFQLPDRFRSIPGNIIWQSSPSVASWKQRIFCKNNFDHAYASFNECEDHSEK